MRCISCSGAPSICTALVFTERKFRSSSRPSTPEERWVNTLSRYPLARTTWRCCNSLAALASDNWRIIWLNKPVNAPNSSLPRIGYCPVKSPCATARVPSASASSDEPNLSLRKKAADNAVNTTTNIDSVSVIAYSRFSPSRENVSS